MTRDEIREEGKTRWPEFAKAQEHVISAYADWVKARILNPPSERPNLEQMREKIRELYKDRLKVVPVSELIDIVSETASSTAMKGMLSLALDMMEEGL